MKRILSFFTTIVFSRVVLHAQTFTYDVVNKDDRVKYTVTVNTSSQKVSVTNGGRSAFSSSYYDYDLEDEMISFAFRQGRAPLFKLMTAVVDEEKCVIIKSDAIGCYNPSTDIAYNLIPANANSYTSTYNRMMNSFVNAKLNEYSSTENFEESFKWLQKAAENGSPEIQKTIGDCYYYGRGVTPSFPDAVEWYSKSADQGNVEAMYQLGYALENRSTIDKSLVSRAHDAYRRAAEEGYPPAIYKMGEIAYKENNLEEAVLWYRMSADLGNAEAQFKMGGFYENGLKKCGIDKNQDEAMSWYLKAAQNGLADAQYTLGERYAKKKDYAEAAKWYQMAAEQNYPKAEEKLEAVLKKL